MTQTENLEYKERAKRIIKTLCKEYKISPPKIYLREQPDILSSLKLKKTLVELMIDSTEIMNRTDLTDYQKGKIIGQFRALVNCFKFTNEDFKRS